MQIMAGLDKVDPANLCFVCGVARVCARVGLRMMVE
jgi:hypothetical protein